MTIVLLATLIRQLQFLVTAPAAAFSVLLLCVLCPTLGVAQSINDTVFELDDHGQRRRFELACDELSCTPKATGIAHSLEIAKVANGKSVKAKASELQASTGERLDLVLYEVGKPRSIASRRVLTRKVMVTVKTPADRDRFIAAFPAAASEKPSYAKNIVILTLADPGDSLTSLTQLRKTPGVVSAMPLLARQQAKKLIPNDALFTNDPNKDGYQWHLQNTGDRGGVAGVDANVVSVWDTYRGSGIVIGIIDDGLEVSHPDIAPNVDTANDHDWNDATPNDPTGDATIDNHGTSCAGVAAARGNNAIGGSGVAPEATLVGLRLIAAGNTDADEAEALGWMPDHIDITSNSWGPSDLPDNLSGPGTLTQATLRNTAALGRDGLGTLHFWAAGNGGTRDDNSNYDGYANSIYTIAVGATGDQGERAGYSEPGANMVVSAPSNGNGQGITTTTTFGDYTYSFGGTSSATPLVAGVAALMLEANPTLGWRDVQEILILSARQIDAAHPDWTTNGAGLHFNHSYGAGLVDAGAAVALASGWSTLPTQRSQVISLDNIDESIPDNDTNGVTKSFQVVAADSLRVEHVTLSLTTPHSYRGDLKVVLQSPSGTESILSLPRNDDGSGYAAWTFMSVRNWGESSQGSWQVTVSDEQTGNTGVLEGLTLTIFGTDQLPPSAAPVIVSQSASAQTGSQFLYQINASNRPTAYSATNLPTGLELESTSGLISGVPEVSGTFTVELTASNSLGSASGQLILTVSTPTLEPPVIVGQLTLTATVGLPFYYQIVATNEPEIYEAQGLPPGLEVEASTGIIFGNPEEYGLYTSSIQAINAAGETSAFLDFNVRRPAGLAISEAADHRSPFYLGGHEVWYPQTAVTSDGTDALQSPPLGEGESSSFETDVVGPATVTFQWKVSSEESYDWLRFALDDTVVHEISGDQDWAQIEYEVPEGAHRLKWAYSKD
ncbi:MAG: subtilisin-like proprotein convertase family protein, partial [Verrucomicrobiales bacterium]